MDQYRGIALDALPIVDVDWMHAADHIRSRTKRKGSANEVDIEPEWATQACLDARRLVALTAGRSLQVVGYSAEAGRLLKCWIIPKDDDNVASGLWWGASACAANNRDEKRYEKDR